MKQLSDRFDEIGDAGQRELDEGGGDPAFSAAPVMVQRPAASGSARASRTPRGAPLSPRAGDEGGGRGDSRAEQRRGEGRRSAGRPSSSTSRRPPAVSTSRPQGDPSAPRSPTKGQLSGPVRVYSDKELGKEFEGLAKTLRNMDHDAWTDRQEACERLTALCEGGACEFESFVPGFGKWLRDPVADAINDLRSSIVKAACIMVSTLSRHLGDAFEPFAAHYVPSPLNLALVLSAVWNWSPALYIETADPEAACLEQVPILWTKTIITIQVIAESSHECVRDVLHNTQCPKLLRSAIEIGTADRDARLRAKAMEYLAVMLQRWSDPAIEKSIQAVDDAIRKGMKDANSEARAAARRCYWAISPRWPDRAQRILASIDPSTHRLLLSEEYQPSSPTLSTYTKARRQSTRSPGSSPSANGRRPPRSPSGQPPVSRFNDADDEPRLSAAAGGGGGGSGGGGGRPSIGDGGRPGRRSPNAAADKRRSMGGSGVGQRSREGTNAPVPVARPLGARSRSRERPRSSERPGSRQRPGSRSRSRDREPRAASEASRQPDGRVPIDEPAVAKQARGTRKSGSAGSARRQSAGVGSCADDTTGPSSHPVVSRPRSALPPSEYDEQPVGGAAARVAASEVKVLDMGTVDQTENRTAAAVAVRAAPQQAQPVFGELLLQCDDSIWSVRCEAFRDLNRFCCAEGAMDVLRHLEALLGRFLEHANDAHHRVSQAALVTLAAYIECFAEHFETYLPRLTPKVFLKISDAKESTRDAAVAVLEAMRAAYSSDTLLPVLAKTLGNSNGKVRLGCIDFLHYLLQHCEHAVRPFFESQTQMKACVGQLTPLVVDRNASLRKLSGKSLAALYRMHKNNFLGALASLSGSQQANAIKAMERVDVTDLDAELAAFTGRGSRVGGLPDRPPPIGIENAPRSASEDEALPTSVGAARTSSARGSGRLHDTGNGAIEMSSPPIAGMPLEQPAYDDGGVGGTGDALYRRAVGVKGGESYGYEDTTLGHPPNGAGSYPEPAEQHQPVRAEQTPAAAPVVAVVRRGSSGNAHHFTSSSVGHSGPREDSGEQWGDLIPPLLAALSTAGGGGGEERRVALAQLGNLSRRAAPTLWTRYFGQLLLLVLEALHVHDAPTREAVRLPWPIPFAVAFLSV